MAIAGVGGPGNVTPRQMVKSDIPQQVPTSIGGEVVVTYDRETGKMTVSYEKLPIL